MTEEKIREQLEHKLLKLEAQEACRNLMGRYSYYGTAFRNKETVELWAKREDAQLMTPWGSYDGHDGIKACYLEDIGDRSDTRVFEAIKGAVIIHEIDTEVIEVAEDLQTAKAAFLSQGNDTYVDRTENEKVHAKWVWEKYSVDFIMEDGEWKIWHMTIIHCFNQNSEKDGPTIQNLYRMLLNSRMRNLKRQTGIMTEMNCIQPMSLQFLNHIKLMINAAMNSSRKGGENERL